MRLIVPDRVALVIFTLVFALVPLWGEASAASYTSSPTSDTVTTTNAVLVRFRETSRSSDTPTAAEQRLLSQAGATGVIEWLGAPGVYRVVVRDGLDPETVAAALDVDPSVIYAEPDRAIRLHDSVSQFQSADLVTSTSSRDWALDAIHAPDAWRLGTGKGVVVAVLDTGVSASHPDLASHVLPGWNVIQNNADALDDSGHGTFVAGLIVASSRSRSVGVAPGASILPVKILNSSGVGSTASFVAGINYAINAGARIINISASGASNSSALNDALASAESHGVLVVGSSGNDASEQAPYPAAVSTVLAVSASDQNNKKAAFSSFGPYVDIAAPGASITSTWWSSGGGNGYATASGSSASAPLVSGAAAIVVGLRPDVKASTLREILTESAQDIESPHLDAQTGYGLLDVYAAARIANPPSGAGSASIATFMSSGHEHLSFDGTGFRPGESLSVWTSSSEGYKVNRLLSAGETGSFSADLGPAWEYPLGTLSAYAVGNNSDHAVSAQFVITANPAASPFKSVPVVDSTPDRTYFAATGHTLAYGFKQFWESHGGLAVFGYPISEEFTEKNPDDGQTYTVQYFERNRFEYHPEYAGTPWEVSLGRIDVQIAPQTFPVAPAPPDSNALYFDATQHTLSGPFRDFWESHGGLEMFGYPTSEPFEQGGLLVQYFERSRFELHPNWSTGSQVLLARLGIDLAREEGYLH